MRLPLLALLAASTLTLACSSSSSGPSGPPTASSIAHLVVVIQENHSFDAYFGAYCTAPTGSAPSCNDGPACCEAAPAKDPGSAMAPTALNDAENAAFDPDHFQACEVAEIDNGKMDMYVTAPALTGGVVCGSPHNFAAADSSSVGAYWNFAKSGALADHYFQSAAGQSSENDMYFARARFVFIDNGVTPTGIGSNCQVPQMPAAYTDTTIGDLLTQANVPWAFYAEGYQAAVTAGSRHCPAVPSDCAGGMPTYPCVYDPGDNPFQFFNSTRDDPKHELDYGQLAKDLSGGTLPSVAYVKGLGYHSEHPGYGDTISGGTTFVSAVVNAVAASQYAASTLVLVTYDESGGYFDHIAPPAMSPVDNQPYGPRIPMLAVGQFASVNHVSHVPMEHSSIVKFIEWNWLGQKVGQLGGRDATASNLGSLLDSSKTGAAVPDP